MRSSFTATIQFGVVTIPVKGFTTKESSNEIKLNQLHDKCWGRIKYKKCCETCGEIPPAEIVKGYEYSSGQYVQMDPKELSLESKTIDVQSFVKPGAVDLRYFAGKSYYLQADEIGQKAYHLLVAAMLKTRQVCIAKAVISGREQLVRIRPVDGVLCLQVLNYAEDVRSADCVDNGKPSHTKQELTLALDLIKATTTPVHFTDYPNPYNAHAKRIVEAKVDGQEIVTPATQESEEPQTINLMDALKASVAAKKKAKSATTRRKAKQA